MADTAIQPVLQAVAQQSDKAALYALIGLIFNGVMGLVMFFLAHWMRAMEKNTNSMKDALVKVTGEAEFSKGHFQGGADKQAEIDAKIVAAGQKK
jgi:hypothetical protein